MMGIKSKKRLISYSLLLLLAIYVLIYQTILIKHFLKYADVITSIVLIVVTFVAFMSLGYQKDKPNFVKKEVFKNTLLILVAYFAIIYLVGTKVGFLKNAYSLSLSGILNNILSPIVLVVSSELLRYLFISNSRLDENGTNNKVMIFITTIVLILVDLNPLLSMRMFTSNSRTFSLITSIVIPSITKNVVLSYMTSKTGYRTSLLYRIILDLYIYLVPVFPDLNEYFSSMLGILLPFLTYLYASRIIVNYDGKEEEKLDRSLLFKVGDVALITLSVLLISLVSTKFSYYLLGIASGSMEPEIRVGDAVLAHKLKENEELEVGDIIVFQQNGIKVVHRIDRIENDENGKKFFITKGDANKSNDNNRLYYEDIEAKVLFKIPYIGIPTVWASNLLN